MTHVDTLHGLIGTRDALVSAFQSITLDGKGVKVYEYDPGLVNASNFIAVTLPALEFPNFEDAQRQMGTYDVEFNWPVLIYIDGQNLQYAQLAAIKLMSAVTDAIEADETLDGNVEDVRVTEITPSWEYSVSGDTVNKTMIVIECTLQGVMFINQ